MCRLICYGVITIQYIKLRTRYYPKYATCQIVEGNLDDKSENIEPANVDVQVLRTLSTLERIARLGNLQQVFGRNRAL